MHYSSQLDEQFTVVFMTVSHSAQMLLKLEKCIPISHVTLETVPKYANIERPTSSQLYASHSCSTFGFVFLYAGNVHILFLFFLIPCRIYKYIKGDHIYQGVEHFFLYFVQQQMTTYGLM